MQNNLMFLNHPSLTKPRQPHCHVITAPKTLKGSRNIRGFALIRALLFKVRIKRFSKTEVYIDHPISINTTDLTCFLLLPSQLFLNIILGYKIRFKFLSFFYGKVDVKILRKTQMRPRVLGVIKIENCKS